MKSDPTMKKIYCTVEISDDKFKAFTYAIRNHYWYQMYIGKFARIPSGVCVVLIVLPYMFMTR